MNKPKIRKGFKVGDYIKIISCSEDRYIDIHDLMGKIGRIKSLYGGDDIVTRYDFSVTFINGEHHAILSNEIKKITKKEYFLEVI